MMSLSPGSVMERVQIKFPLYAWAPSGWAPGMVLMMSLSPGSVMERVQTLKYLPQGVPSSLLLPAERWRVVRDDHQLGLSTPQGFQGLLVAEHVLAGLHDQGKPRVDGFIGLLDLLLGSHDVQV